MKGKGGRKERDATRRCENERKNEPIKRFKQTMSFSSAVNPRTWTEYLAARQQGTKTEVSERRWKRLGELDEEKRTLGNLLGKLNSLNNLVNSRSDRALNGSVVLGTDTSTERKGKTLVRKESESERGTR